MSPEFQVHGPPFLIHFLIKMGVKTSLEMVFKKD